jgi:hypothetical protein
MGGHCGFWGVKSVSFGVYDFGKSLSCGLCLFVFANHSAIRQCAGTCGRRGSPDKELLVHGERTYLLTISRELRNAY